MTELDYEYLAKLVKKTQKGDSDAFAELYTATYKKQYRFTYQYVKDPYLAQDVLQDVYILVLKNINALKNPRLFISWLNQINFRICFDVCKKRNVQSQELNRDVYNPSDEDMDSKQSDTLKYNPEKQIEKRDEQVQIMSQVLALPPKEAQAIIMRYYNDMTIDDIADAMNCSKSTVKRRLARGQSTLKTVLGEEKGGEQHE